MLISVSGMVGSGKSTVSKRVVALLGAAGADCRRVQFRSRGFPLFSKRLSAPAPGRAKATGQTEVKPTALRCSGFRPRSLTAWVTFAYIVRMVAFRIFGPCRTEGWIVLDRYFYDSLVHYQLTTSRERWYVALLQRIMPVPDLAILLVASSTTILKRRPNYAAEYVLAAVPGYERLMTQFPELVAIRTDEGELALDRLDALIHERVVNVADSPHA